MWPNFMSSQNGAYYVKIFWTSLIFNCLISIASSQSSFPTEKPLISIRNELEMTEWREMTLELGQRGIVSLRGDDLILLCQASYPIRWNISGIIAPAEIVKFQPPKRNLLTGTFELQINFFYLDAGDFSGLLTSARISCESVTNQMSDEIFVFVKGSNPLVTSGPKLVTDSNLIPCPTTDPATPTLLFQKTRNGGQEALIDKEVVYHPTEGFRSSSSRFFSGQYVCRKESFSVTVTADVTRVEQFASFEFSPSSGSIRVFSEESVTIRCSSSNSNPVSITVRGNGENQDSTVKDVKVKYKINTDSSKEIEISPDLNGVGENNQNLKGTVICSSTLLRTGETITIKEWSYEFIETPELFLDNYEGEVYCLSSLSPKFMQTVRCKNDMDCHFMSHCLQNASWCNFKKQKQFFANAETFCYLESLGRGKPCVSVPYSHLNGAAQCTVSGLAKRWNFFVSLEFLRHSSWLGVQEHELIRMDEVEPILYTNLTTNFFCVASAYLFADSLTFQIEYENGTRMYLENDGNNVNVSNPSIENPRKIDEFNVLGSLEIQLPLKAVAVHCIAPWWNSTEVMITARKFETRHLLSPEIEMQDETKNEIFYRGDMNQRLTCSAHGEPQPSYDWYFDKDQNVSQVFPELKRSVGSSGEGYLEFPSMQSKYVGMFRCVARNRVGESSKMFSVTVTDEPISGKNVVLYVSTIVPILIILAVVLIALVIFMKRYNEAKELVRSLTDIEIDEFFQGKPELLQDISGNVNTPEVIDFLPYQKEYEIPLDDIEFDASEKNWLGSGEFSYVVRGHIKSRSNKPVAVKISKPSADVSIFKSLLSEVKIMIYIGKHEHVVSLVGVCTEGIRNRSIYIATEICDMGSLDTLLRKARPDFNNLINANQEIDMTLFQQSAPGQLSTLDLVDFSAQIAKGMEYLAFKSIVHADLAARNVLLTANKLAKISDFGLSKKLYECNNYVKKSKSPLPWRWMAVESLTTLTFSTKSDVWSYGTTLFEIFTLGDIPFPNEEWNKEFLVRLNSGMRMGRPKYSTQAIYSEFVPCWESDPELRPSFSQLRHSFETLLHELQIEAGLIAPAPGAAESSQPIMMYTNFDPSSNELSTLRTIPEEISNSLPNYANVP